MMLSEITTRRLGFISVAALLAHELLEADSIMVPSHVSTLASCHTGTSQGRRARTGAKVNADTTGTNNWWHRSDYFFSLCIGDF